MNGLSHEAAIRAGFFVAIFAAVALAEIGIPRRRLNAGKSGRWWVNLALTLIDLALVRLLFPILPVGLALFCADRGWGFLNQIPVPFWTAVVVGVLLLDGAIYLQHVLFHMLPLLWRLHGMHHTDLDIDVTTGLRFHPLEIVLSMGIKLVAVAALGVPAPAVLAFEILLNGTSLFNHGNIRLPLSLDRLLRWIVVTPDMHRVHHSIVVRETNSNYGFSFPWWDRLFGTYRPQPAAGHEGMTIGLSGFRDEKALTLRAMLLLPFPGRGLGWERPRKEPPAAGGNDGGERRRSGEGAQEGRPGSNSPSGSGF